MWKKKEAEKRYSFTRDVRSALMGFHRLTFHLRLHCYPAAKYWLLMASRTLQPPTATVIELSDNSLDKRYLSIHRFSTLWKTVRTCHRSFLRSLNWTNKHRAKSLRSQQLLNQSGYLHAFNGIRRFIILFKEPRICSYLEPDKFRPQPHTFLFKTVLILSSHSTHGSSK